MKKRRIFVLLLVSSLFVFCACHNTAETENNYESIFIPDGYGLIYGAVNLTSDSVNLSSDSRSAFAGLKVTEDLFYKVTATDADGVLPDVVATMQRKNANLVKQDSVDKRISKYQLMLPYGTWNLKYEGFLSYDYDSINEIESYSTKAFSGVKENVIVKDSKGYNVGVDVTVTPDYLESDESGTVNLPISITAVSVLGAKAIWKQNIGGIFVEKTQTLPISSNKTDFTMIADDGTNASGVPSGNYSVRFEFYDTADCSGNLLYTCKEDVNVLYKVITETNCWIKSDYYGSKHLVIQDNATDSYIADFIVSDSVLFDSSNAASGYSGNGKYTMIAEDDILISISDIEFFHKCNLADPDVKTITVEKLNADGSKTEITNTVESFTMRLYNIGVQDISTSDSFSISGKSITTLKDLPYEEEFKLYVSFCYNNRYYGATFDLKVESEFNFYEEPIDESTGLPATSSSTSVYFGVFPQTVLPSTSTVVISETQTLTLGGNTYYRGDDKNYYLKVTENAYDGGGTCDTNYSDGTTSELIAANNFRYFKLEPIKWKVITSNYNGSGKALLLSKKALTSGIPFYINTSSRTINGKTIPAADYKYSTIRAYLNGVYETNDTQNSTYTNNGFLQNAFSNKGQKNIVNTSITNQTDNSILQDKIFLLDLSEVKKSEYGFDTSSGTSTSRVMYPSDYAIANYCYKNSTKGARWYLRGTYSGSNARLVDYDGDLGESYSLKPCTDKSRAIVPALCVSLE